MQLAASGVGTHAHRYGRPASQGFRQALHPRRLRWFVPLRLPCWRQSLALPLHLGWTTCPDFSLGSYPELSLREAREFRDQARALVAKGINPRTDRKQKRQAIRLAGENTFMAVYEKWMEHRQLTLEEGRQSSLEQIRRVFKKDVFPCLKRYTIY
ncbi:integrase arm-type DNA-binding domain-containing protein [Pseudomonas syringae pv. tomato]|uniref:Integrase arm-type DNA-binding domain-containing protein n=1 Tax=Pseudomonas syringae TaxID=317 RepID=A0AAW4E3U3_PSESX|nr:integrase arm-type DNA-binding domain-containing protein [Pseudomonas syringae pv. tomato]MBI6696885.1 integrase arm-type DNA-binding domain-containing protein [Pseudomonas syringae]MBI6715478.1 integrase arm-type DNA-binding domain-containing protein [Pseudomonas syringae]MBI6736857.1 integrase arm-type DNA-binding domain-containing protein [Pseudomonas syringae]MBI6843483.1 integrase arm-type DNA-binding domain-containing protein [Pseudomonas syringae]